MLTRNIFLLHFLVLNLCFDDVICVFRGFRGDLFVSSVVILFPRLHAIDWAGGGSLQIG